VSRNQWIILGALALAVVLVFGCLGGFALTHLTGQPPTETPEPVQASDTATATVSRTPTHSPTPILPTHTPEPPTPTNTRVMPLTTPTPIPPTPTSTRYPTYTPYPTYTSVPTPTETVAPAPTSPPAPPPAPPVDIHCVDTENAYHQQMLAYIEAEYAPILSRIEYQYELAARKRDWVTMRDLQREYQMYENMKAADINAENARHQAALVACG